MNKETTLSLLNHFVDHSRDSMSQPFVQNLKIGRFWCATNGRMVCLVPEGRDNKCETATESPSLNIDGVLPSFDDAFDADWFHLKELYDNVPEIERFILEMCDSCDGNGTFEHYRFYYRCKKCNESGTVETSSKEIVKTPDVAFKFGSTLISIHELSLLFTVAKSINRDEFSFKILFLSNRLIWFKIDDIIVAICSVSADGVETWQQIDVRL